MPPQFALRDTFISFGLLAASIFMAAFGGSFFYSLLKQVQLSAPLYWLLIFAGVLLIPLLVLAKRLHSKLTRWYYLLPAILFLLVFTIYPIVLTIYLAFTDYAGNRRGEPNRVTETRVLQSDSETLELEHVVADALRCGDACVGRRVEVRSEVERGVSRIESVEGPVVRLTDIPVAEPSSVTIINDFSFVGLQNFKVVISRASQALLPVLVWNLVFAAATVVLVATAGTVLAVLLNDKSLHFRGVYRTLLVISWAVPGVISIQMWQALLNQQFGAINRLLGLLGVYPIPWLLDPLWAKMAILLVNLWLGFPFMMVAALGVLSTIPNELYEAARIDGASPLQMFTHVTSPLLYPGMLPVLLTSFAFNFNNFNVIFLLTSGGPAVEGQLATAQATDILISWAYKTAFSSEGQTAYGLGAAISILIFLITIGISLFNFRVTGAFRESRV